MKKTAVVLSGCGVSDGSEIHEATLALLAIVKQGGTYVCFAPEMSNVLEMSSRIARGDIHPLSQYNPDDFDGIFFPGGMGAVKNLCSFADDGVGCRVNADVEKAIKATYQAKKPIAALCIAPVLVAKVMGKGKLTIGNDVGTATAIRQMGAEHVEKDAAGVCVDEENRLVSSPAYMLARDIAEVEQSAANAVAAMMGMM